MCSWQLTMDRCKASRCICMIIPIRNRSIAPIIRPWIVSWVNVRHFWVYHTLCHPLSRVASSRHVHIAAGNCCRLLTLVPPARSQCVTPVPPKVSWTWTRIVYILMYIHPRWVRFMASRPELVLFMRNAVYFTLPKVKSSIDIFVYNRFSYRNLHSLQ